MDKEKVKEVAVNLFASAISELSYYLEKLLDARAECKDEEQIALTDEKIREHQELINIHRAAKRFVSGKFDKANICIVFNHKPIGEYILVKKEDYLTTTQLSVQESLDDHLINRLLSRAGYFDMIANKA